MNLVKAIELMKKYEHCGSCGNNFIGKNDGALEVTDDKFIRSCKCGWAIIVTEKEVEDGQVI